MPITLYYAPFSQPSRAILALLTMANIEHEAKVVDLMKGEQNTEEYIKICPTSNVPAITDDDFKLFESHAILRYVCRKHNLFQFYPENPQHAAKIDAFLDWHHTGTRQCAIVTREIFFFPKFFNRPEPANKDGLLQDLEWALGFFVKVFLDEGKHQFIYGLPNPTIADIQAACELTTLFLLNFDFTKHPVLYQYIERTLAIPEIRKAHEAFFQFVKAQVQGLNEQIVKLVN